MSESGYWERTDTFEQKMKLLEAAWKRNDFRVVRALTNSLRIMAMQAQAEEENPRSPVTGVREDTVDSLPAAWRAWAKGWSRFQAFALDETAGQNRPPEPVELTLRVAADHADSLAREVRVARIADGELREVPCQVFGEIRRGQERLGKVLFLAGGAAHQRQSYLIFYGNPDAELPQYPSDLETRGEGYGLDIENDFFRAKLSRQMGQLERLTIKREHGLELFAGGEGHGEPPGIDWAHDYVTSGRLQKLRITLWETCPDYEVVRGPLCTIVRRWGFPYSPVHPIFSPARIHMDVEYRFYSGLPWFHKTGTMTALKDVEVDALRDDEWVFSGQSFTDILWMGPDGKLRTGPVAPEFADNIWAVGFCNNVSKDSFLALFLEHRGEGLPELKHSGSPMMYYRWHGHVWSRYPLPVKNVPAGAVLHQKNAYVAIPFPTKEGPRQLEDLRHRLLNPYQISALANHGSASREQGGQLARPGEAGDSPISKKALWDALGGCKDEQLYASDINVVDLGLVYDIRVRGDVVHVVMTMPHRGRPLLGYFTYGSGGNTTPVRQQLMKVPGVRKVVVEQTWEPGWNSNRLTPEGRRKLGLDS
ncbi:MAG: metal-sulfur cluster assembly factor [Bryobacterales bacterium]|nr:metal-sulfur cluster assembly factor [Bryobacterales bacterium]